MDNDFVKKLMKRMLEEDDKDHKVVKTFPVKPDWAKKFKILEEIAVKEAELGNKRKIMRDGLWGQIHDALNIYDGHFRYNEETKEIEQLEDKE
jgi:hypothetical protein